LTFLVAENVSRRFYGFNALDEVSLSVQSSERRALIGPNGAGKSTLFNILGGQMPASAGTIRLDGRDITSMPSYARARLGVSRTYQRNNLFMGLSVFENVRLAVQARTRASRDLFRPFAAHRAIQEDAREMVTRMSLAPLADKPAGELSYGDQRKLEIAVALAARPRVLLVDEPTAGMSPAETAEMVSVLAGLPRDLALVIVEHDMDVVSALADRVTVLQNGRVIAEGTWREIRGNEFVQRAYIGTGKGR
jgi:branched-chain amino acid transport system ATP-binding protein